MAFIIIATALVAAVVACAVRFTFKQDECSPSKRKHKEIKIELGIQSFWRFWQR
jgi:hypothetical protein